MIGVRLLLNRTRLALTYILLAIPTAAQAPRTVDAIRVISGVILVEDFEQPELDSKIWHRPEWLARHNPTSRWRRSTVNCISGEFPDRPARLIGSVAKSEAAGLVG
jgi:hypothetical protein